MITKIRKFGASWCGPCRTIESILKDINLPVEEVDVEEDNELVEKYKIRNIPVLQFIDDKDEIVRTEVGTISKETLESIINEHS